MSKIETLFFALILGVTIGLTVKVLASLPSQAEIQQVIQGLQK